MQALSWPTPGSALCRGIVHGARLRARHTVQPSVRFATDQLLVLLCASTQALALLLPGLAAAQLNDTGQTQCYDAANTAVVCNAASTGDAATQPRQDGRFGRDAKASAGTLVKTGAGPAGFDFSGQDASGNPIPAGSHACVQDHVTGLIWSTETLPAQNWADAANAAVAYGRCGHASGWRVPSRRELLSIVHHGLGSSPAIDGSYFPATGAEVYWSSDTYAPDATQAWGLDFQDGSTTPGSKATLQAVRMVRNAANHAPTFTPGANIVLDRTARPGPLSIPGWATGIAAGPASEAGQHLTATVRLLPVADQKALEFQVAPTLDLATGTLSFTIKHTIYPLTIYGQTDPSYIQWYSSAGLARVEIELKDDGGTANGGADTTTHTFTIFMDPAPLAVDFSVRNLWKSPCVPITIGGWDADSDPQAEWVYPPWLLPRIFIHTAPARGFVTPYSSSSALAEDASQTARTAAEPSPARAAQQAQNYEFGTELIGTSPALPLTAHESYYASFCYIPFTSTFTGTDSFTFVLVDQDGNVSEPARVNIDIYRP